jgi:hypothetical protein
VVGMRRVFIPTEARRSMVEVLRKLRYRSSRTGPHRSPRIWQSVHSSAYQRVVCVNGVLDSLPSGASSPPTSTHHTGSWVRSFSSQDPRLTPLALNVRQSSQSRAEEEVGAGARVRVVEPSTTTVTGGVVGVTVVVKQGVLLDSGSRLAALVPRRAAPKTTWNNMLKLNEIVGDELIRQARRVQVKSSSTYM